MFEELISKKELLEEMKISYGQLYRWKRKNLIPEEWFIKKSVTTGQETFFPRKKIIERVKRILELKDDVSLDELADRFSYNVDNVKVSREYLINNNIVSNDIIERFDLLIKSANLYDTSRLFCLFLYDKLLRVGLLSLDEVNEIILSSYKSYEKLQDEDYILVIKRKLGICFYYIVQHDLDLMEDSIAVTVTTIKIKEILEKINLLR